MPSYPKKRIIIDKDHGITTEAIPRITKREPIFTKKNKSIRRMRYLSKRRKPQRKKLTQKQRDRRRNQPLKHWKTKGSFYRFRRLETLVKHRNSSMKHWSKLMERRRNPKSKQILRHQLRGASILLIIRIHRKKNLPEKILFKLHRLGLMQTWDAVIVRHSPDLIPILVDLLPYITFGIPTKEVIRDLVLKRGKLFDDKKGIDQYRKEIKSNVIIEKILGKYGVICIEDLIHILSTDPKENDEHETLSGEEIFDGVANAINPFGLSEINIPMKGLKTPFNKCGYHGFRVTFINTFVEKII